MRQSDNSMMSQPKVSVCMPIFRGRDFLSDAIDSVLSPDFHDFELLIVDDCSRDGTDEIVEGYASRDHRVIFKVNDSNLGMVANWNLCLNMARGHYVKFLFQDDILTSPESLRKMVKVIDNDPDVSLVASCRRIIDTNSEVMSEEIFPLANRFSEDSSVEEERRLFYVGVTRAEQEVYLSHARSRYRFGEVAYQSRSRFIDEIDPSTIQEINGGIGRKANRKTKKELFYEYFNSVDYEDFDQDNKVVRIGSRVMHEKFGLGKVIDVTGAGDQVKATVAFEGNNVRQLMLKFARLKILH